jgi:hypothetical protein
MSLPLISFSPSLPCGALAADGVLRCGKDATVGTLYPMGGGEWMLQPFCRECVAGMQRAYGVEGPAGIAPAPKEARHAD